MLALSVSKTCLRGNITWSSILAFDAKGGVLGFDLKTPCNKLVGLSSRHFIILCHVVVLYDGHIYMCVKDDCRTRLMLIYLSY